MKHTRKCNKKKSSRKSKKQRGGADNLFLGIYNPGSCCYNISLMQMLYHIPPVREFFLTQSNTFTDQPVFMAIHRTFQSYHLAEGVTSIRMTDADAITIASCLDTVDPLRAGETSITKHRDPGEFLSFCLFNNEKFPKALTNIFTYNTTITYTCENTKFRPPEAKVEVGSRLDLEIKGSSIRECIDNYQLTEYLRGDNGVVGCGTYKPVSYDTNTKTLIKTKKDPNKIVAVGDGTRKARLDMKLNEYLLISIKRFSFNYDTQKSVKINDPVIMDPVITIMGSLFEIRGFIRHAGQAGGGHYTYYWNNPADNTWILFNDGQVTKNADINNVKDISYIYLYQKKDNVSIENPSNRLSLPPPPASPPPPRPPAPAPPPPARPAPARPAQARPPALRAQAPPAPRAPPPPVPLALTPRIPPAPLALTPRIPPAPERNPFRNPPNTPGKKGLNRLALYMLELARTNKLNDPALRDLLKLIHSTK